MKAYQITATIRMVPTSSSAGPLTEGFELALAGDGEFEAWDRWGAIPLPDVLKPTARRLLQLRGLPLPPEL